MNNLLENNKPILAIETSEKNCGVCLYYNSEKYFEYSFRLKNAHSEKIFELVEQVFHTAGSNINDVSSIAVSSGPGSFTGLRIGMSAAKGLAFGASLPIIPVPTFEAMAMQLCDLLSDQTEFSIANNVNSEELYFAKFQIKGNNFIFVENLTIIKQSDLMKEDKLIFGNANNSRSDVSFLFAAPSAKYVALWGEKFGSDKLTYDYDYLEPDYLKELIIKGIK
ncbi:MAG: tRNA (adenosine(37)-N6)-threonylcarbamoyltransferase complex dimerization subunit type 1 TsaB [Ignavibacteriales bacterium]|nr:MAG: tRNA (adenosine(37)-N6)-threonylcarbamoyltransferase complex dimerization subunit type 1 TsaB [Ignavibacteriales bacterium]